MNAEITCLFVYGTFKKGEIRFKSLEPFVEAVRDAELNGAVMYDLGPYPAIKINGSKGKVKGQLFKIKKGKMLQALELADRIEGYRIEFPNKSLYLRKEVKVQVELGWIRAFTYEWNNLKDISDMPIVENWIDKEDN